jgi:hypothetical protein
MTNKVIEFPKTKTADDIHDIMYALDVELTELSTKSLELGLPIYSIIGVMQGQIYFLLGLEAGDGEDDEQ